MNFSTYFASYRAAGLAAAVLLLSGCPDKEEQTGTDSDSGAVTDAVTGGMSTTSATSGGTSENPTTTQDGGTMGGTEGGVSTSGEPQTTGVVPETTTDGTTGGVVSPELEASCGAVCDKFVECPLPPPLPPLFPDKATCVMECIGSAEGADQACVDATVTFNECVGTFTCAELLDALMSEDLGKCADAQQASDMACAGNVCESFGGAGDTGCSIGKACPNEPMQEYSCEGDTCTCLVDGVSNGVTCPANGFCDLDFDAQSQAAFDCCGFEL